MAKTKGELTRCGGTMTEAQWLAWVRSALRSKWLRWPPRAEALKAARRSYRGPKTQQKWEYKCAMCTEWFMQKEVEVDHYPEDAGSILSSDDIGPFVNRLYCETDNLRILCKPCHKVYTLASSKGISLDEARLEKSVTEKMKDENILDYLASYGYTGASVSNATKRKALVTSILRDALPKEK
jgi:hypothetical protein